MFFSKDFDKLYSDLLNKNVILREAVNMPSGRIFNFADNENNYYASNGNKINVSNLRGRCLNKKHRL